MKRLLMIAFHFPPAKGASGTHRTVGFARHLPEFGWQPVVLTVHPMAHPLVEGEECDSFPYPVHRGYALDSSRHLAIAGRYSRLTALPDRWSSWWLSGVPLGMQLIRRYRPEIIWSTYPIATGHLIARTLSRLSTLPWVGDFRDPMCSPLYPADPFMRRVLTRLEDDFITRCQRVVTTTGEIARIQQQRHPHLPANHWQVISNGWDELPPQEEIPPPSPLTSGPCVEVLHSGTIYHGDLERSPLPLFRALSHLRQAGVIRTGKEGGGGIGLRLTFRAPGDEKRLQQQIADHGLNGLVVTGPPLCRQDAMTEMAAADALLLMQGESFNAMVPAKVFEYWLTGKPILPLIHPGGETARLLASVGLTTTLPLLEVGELAAALATFLQDVVQGRVKGTELHAIQPYSRRQRTAQLASLLDQVADHSSL